MTITEFLTARFDEDEAVARAVRKPCPHCGRRPGDKTYVPTAWTDDSA